jgi:hypothetical protein
MYMQDWTTKLHGFLSLNDREILDHPGKVSAAEAESHALAVFEKYRAAEIRRLEIAEDDLDRAIKKINLPKSDAED